MNWKVVVTLALLTFGLLFPQQLFVSNRTIQLVSASGRQSSYNPYVISVGSEFHVYFEHDMFDIDTAWNEQYWITSQDYSWTKPKNINNEFGLLPFYQSPALVMDIIDGYRIIYHDNATFYWLKYSSAHNADLVHESRDYAINIIEKIGIHKSQLEGRIFRGAFRHMIQENGNIAAILEVTLITRNHDATDNINLGPFLLIFNDVMDLTRVYSLTTFPNYPTQGVYFVSSVTSNLSIKSYNILWVNQHENTQFSLIVEGDTVSMWNEMEVQLYQSDEWNFIYFVVDEQFLFIYNTNSKAQKTILRFIDLNNVGTGVKFLNFPTPFSLYESPSVSLLDIEKEEFLILWQTDKQIELWTYSQQTELVLEAIRENDFNLDFRFYTFPLIRTSKGWDSFWHQTVVDHTEIFTMHIDQSSDKRFNFNQITQITNTSDITDDYNSQFQQAFIGLDLIPIIIISLMISIIVKIRKIYEKEKIT